MRHGIGLFISAAWIAAGIILLLAQKSHNDAIVLLCFLIIGMGLIALLVTAYFFKQRELSERTNKLLQELIDLKTGEKSNDSQEPQDEGINAADALLNKLNK